MERSDSRLLPVAALNERRRRAVILRLNGMTLDEVCALSELSRNTVIAALKAYRAGGWEAVAVQAHRGPGKGAGCLLDAEPQQAIQAWLNDEYPALAQRAKAEDGEIYWGDETGLRLDDVRGRSYAPAGRTPVMRPCHRRENVGVMSAVTNRGVVRWMILKQAMNPALLIDFLRRLVREAGRKVFLILDNLPAHHAPPVQEWLEKHRDKMEVFYLPSYSPELNPDEMLNADLKEAITKKAPLRHKGERLCVMITVDTKPDSTKGSPRSDAPRMRAESSLICTSPIRVTSPRKP